ncbi:Neuropathy target esterase [Hypsibius exemplaris]|uniref:lysophospholipase n=1 Tax=Hypsibius exemplaris TaxID=2072580 RepID=A0A1W0XEW3_HYPEX|nr:Neuropathy target esterase [Hypsibius exemplaris]
MSLYLQAFFSHLSWSSDGSLSSPFASVFGGIAAKKTYSFFPIMDHPFWAIFTAIIVLLVTLGYCWYRWGLSKAARKTIEDSALREAKRIAKKFPKKEKVRFYYNKWLHRVNALRYGDSPGGKQRLKSRQIVEKIAKNLLNKVRLKDRFRKRSDANLPRLVRKELPASYLEEHAGVSSKSSKFPPEVVSMMRAIRVFGHLEEPVFLELCRRMISLEVNTNELLFQPGDCDDSVYMVQKGRILVFVTDLESGRELPLKEVKSGESIASMLSILDNLSGNERPFKTVTSRALEPSIVLRMPVSAFGEVLERNPEALVRVVQLIMTRLQRVTFSALRDYLGLSHELMKSDKSTLQPANAASSPYHQRHSSGGGILDSNTGYKDESHRVRSVSIISMPVPTPPRPGVVGGEASGGRRAISPIRNTDENFLGSKRFSSSFKERGGRQAFRMARSISCFEESALPQDDEYERAMRDLVDLLGLSSANMESLDDKILYKRAQPGMYLVHELDNDSSMYYVVSGSLSVSQKLVDKADHRNTHLFVAVRGELVGTLAVLTGEPSMFNIRAKVPSKVLTITRSDFFELLRENPHIALSAAHCFAERMSPFVRQIDFALDWEQMESGRAVYRQDDEADSVYVVLNGRVRSVVKRSDGTKEWTGEYARGDLVGLAEVSIHKPRMTTVLAVRDSEVAKIPTHVLEYIKRKYPKVVSRLIYILGSRIFGQMQQRSGGATETFTGPNLTTVAIVAVTPEVPLDVFCLEMEASMNELGSTLRLTSGYVERLLGPTALDPVNDHRLALWLGQQEDIHRMVLFQCDHTMTQWTKQCLRQADCILIVGNGDRKPTIGSVEKQLDSMDLRAEKKLVLLHRPETIIPKNTADWLNMRGWVSSHHHIKCSKRMYLRKSPSWFEEYYEAKKDTIPDKFSDFSRLSRVLMGKAIGVALGGGGARGAAHIGVIKAMIEAGVPIDMVGGTSIGSFVSALWCEERNVTGVIQRARVWFNGMTSLWAQLTDLTYPYTAMFKGTAFNRSIEQTFADAQIEDLWIPYFNVTTDITQSCMRVHKMGQLWRYVRASMSLSGYLPPLCDPVDGHLLLDGGYVNNLPADVMQQQGANFIFAVDVGSQDDYNLTNYGDELSGWWLLWSKWNPFGTPPRIPTMAEVQTRLAYVSCVRTLEIVKKSDYCVYVRPPIECFKTLEFNKFDLICAMGYDYGKAFLREESIRKKIADLFTKEEGTTLHRPGVGQHARVLAIEDTVPGLHYTFTDLAQIVSQQPVKRSSSSESSSDDLFSPKDDEVSDTEDAEDEPKSAVAAGEESNGEGDDDDMSAASPSDCEGF